MKPAPSPPESHLFVCVNRREAGSPLGPGCSAAGDGLYDALKAEVGRRGLVRTVWVTRTHCLGLCPATGASAAAYPQQRLWDGVTAADAPALLERALADRAGAGR